MTRSTIRLIVVPCPICGVELQVYVRGIGPMLAEEWLSLIDDEDRLHLHDSHSEDVTVVGAKRFETKP